VPVRGAVDEDRSPQHSGVEWRLAIALVQFHLLKVARFIYGGGVKIFRCVT